MCARIFDNDSTRQHSGGREDLGGKKGFLSGQCVMATRRESQRGHLSETKVSNPKEPFVKPGTSTGVRARAQPERHKPVKKTPTCSSPSHTPTSHTTSTMQDRSGSGEAGQAYRDHLQKQDERWKMIRVEDVNNSHQPWPHDRQLTVKEVSGVRRTHGEIRF